jgi:hypothetical protein
MSCDLQEPRKLSLSFLVKKPVCFLEALLPHRGAENTVAISQRLALSASSATVEIWPPRNAFPPLSGVVILPICKQLCRRFILA